MAEELDVGGLSFVQAWPEIAELRSKKLSGSITKDEKKRLNALENVYSRNINTTMSNFLDNLMPADNDLLKEYNVDFQKRQGSPAKPPHRLMLPQGTPFLNPENDDIFKEPVPDIDTLIPTSSEIMTLRMMKKIKSNEKLLKEIHQEIVKFISDPVKMDSNSAWNDCGDNYGKPKFDGSNTYEPHVQEMWRLKQLFSYFNLDELSKTKVISKRRDRFTKVAQSNDRKEQNKTEIVSKTAEYKKLLNEIGLNDDLSMVIEGDTEVHARLRKYDTRLYHNISFSDAVKSIMFRTNIYAYYPELVGRTGINYLLRQSGNHTLSLHTQYRPTILDYVKHTNQTPYNYNNMEEWRVFGYDKKGWKSSMGLPNYKTMIGVVQNDYFTVGDWTDISLKPSHTKGNNYISKGEFLCAPNISWSSVMNRVDYYVLSKLLLEYADASYKFKDMEDAKDIAKSVEKAMSLAVSKIPKVAATANTPNQFHRINALKEVMNTIYEDGSELLSNPKKYNDAMNTFLQELYDNPMPISYGDDDPYQPKFSLLNAKSGRYNKAETAWYMQPMVGSGYAHHTILFFLLAIHNELCEINGVIPMNVKESLIDPATRGVVLYNGAPYQRPTKSGKVRSKKFNDAQLYQGQQQRHENNRAGCEWHGVGFDYSSEMEEPEGVNTPNPNRYLLFKEVTIANVYSNAGIDEENPLDWFANNGLRSKKFLGYIGGKLIQPKVELDWSPINETYEIQMKAILNDLKKINSIADDLRNDSLTLLLKNRRMESLMKSIEEASDEDTSNAIGKGRWKPTNRFFEGRENWGGFANSFTQYFASIYVEFGPNSPASASETGQGSGWGGPTEYTNAQVRDALISKYGKDWWNAFVKMYYAYKEKQIKERLQREQYLLKNMGDWEKDDLME